MSDIKDYFQEPQKKRKCLTGSFRQTGQSKCDLQNKIIENDKPLRGCIGITQVRGFEAG